MVLDHLPAAIDNLGPPRLSELFRRYVGDLQGNDISLAELTAALGEHSLLVAIVLFCLPNCLPAPPGIGSIFALPVLIVAWQLLMGRPSLMLPAVIGRRRISVRHLRWIADKGLRPLLWIEQRCRRRLPWLASHRAIRWHAAAILVLAVVVAFPGPGTNFLPAIAILVVSVGIMEGDGLVVLGGLVFGIAAIAAAGLATFVLFGGIYLGAEALLG